MMKKQIKKISLLIFLGILSAQIPIQARWSTAKIAGCLGGAVASSYLLEKLPERRLYASAKEQVGNFLLHPMVLAVSATVRLCFIRFAPGQRKICDDLFTEALFSFTLFYLIIRVIKPTAGKFLMLFIMEDNLDGAKMACRFGAHGNMQIRCGTTLLALAARYGRSDIVRHLYKRGADPSIEDNNGDKSFFDGSEKFLQSGASKNRKNLLRREIDIILEKEAKKLLTPILLNAYDEGIKPAIRSTLVGKENRGKYELPVACADVIAHCSFCEIGGILTPDNLDMEEE